MAQRLAKVKCFLHLRAQNRAYWSRRMPGDMLVGCGASAGNGEQRKSESGKLSFVCVIYPVVL